MYINDFFASMGTLYVSYFISKPADKVKVETMDTQNDFYFPEQQEALVQDRELNIESSNRNYLPEIREVEERQITDSNHSRQSNEPPGSPQQLFANRSNYDEDERNTLMSLGFPQGNEPPAVNNLII